MIGLNDYRNVMIVFGTVFEMSYHMVFLNHKSLQVITVQIENCMTEVLKIF